MSPPLTLPPARLGSQFLVPSHFRDESSKKSDTAIKNDSLAMMAPTNIHKKTSHLRFVF